MKPIDSFLTRKAKWYTAPHAEKWLLAFVDMAALLLAFLLSNGIRSALGGGVTGGSIGDLYLGPDIVRGQVFIAILLVMVLSLWGKGHYTTRRPFSNEVREVLTVAAVLAIVNAAVFYLGKWQFSRLSLLLNWTLVPVFVLAGRIVLKLVLMRCGGWIRPMVIVGWGNNARETAYAFESEKLMGYSLTAFAAPRNQEKLIHDFVDRNGRAVPCISLGSAPEITLAQLGNPHVVLALEQGGIDAYQDIIQQLSRRANNIQIVPSLRGLPLYGMEVNHFFAHEVLLLTVRNNLARRLPRLVKRLFDVTVSGLALVVASPLLLWIAMQVRKSGNPIFFGHPRCGQHNRTFKCYKFRTMAPNADQLLTDLLSRDPEARAEWERDFKLKNDPRITPIGHFLRRTSLDELPQLWNVFKGEMSLVGPRPVVKAELERYGNQVDYYLEAKPGITGLWQISGRNDVTYEERVYLDAWYVKNWSLFNDIVILFRTIGVILRKDGAY